MPSEIRACSVWLRYYEQTYDVRRYIQTTCWPKRAASCPLRKSNQRRGMRSLVMMSPRRV